MVMVIWYIFLWVGTVSAVTALSLFVLLLSPFYFCFLKQNIKVITVIILKPSSPLCYFHIWACIFVCSRSTMQRGRYSTLSMVMIPVSPVGWGTSAAPDTVGSRTWWSYSTGRNRFTSLTDVWWVFPKVSSMCSLLRDALGGTLWGSAMIPKYSERNPVLRSVHVCNVSAYMSDENSHSSHLLWTHHISPSFLTLFINDVSEELNTLVCYDILLHVLMVEAI